MGSITLQQLWQTLIDGMFYRCLQAYYLTHNSICSVLPPCLPTLAFAGFLRVEDSNSGRGMIQRLS